MTKVAGRLHDSTLLTIEQGYLLHIVKRELSQVYLPILGIAQLDAVVRDAQMVGTHRTDIDSLDASHAAIVLQLDTREIAQGIGHAVGIEAFELLTIEGLRGNHLFMIIARDDHHLVNMLYAVEPARLVLGPKRNSSHHQYYGR